MAVEEGDFPGLQEPRQIAIPEPSGLRADRKPHEGHRERLKQRFHETRGAGFRDDELLELLLFLAFPRRDTKQIARKLIARFGSLAEAINAPHARLREIEGIGESAATHIAAIGEAGRRIAHAAIDRRAPLSSWTALVQYCRAAMAFQDVECFRILFLDKRNGLIRDEEQQRGTVDHTPVYAREVIKRALELSATALILVHNHPSGDVTPSQADIQVTREIINVAKPLGIQVHDHVIVGRHGEASLKGLGLI